MILSEIGLAQGRQGRQQRQQFVFPITEQAVFQLMGFELELGLFVAPWECQGCDGDTDSALPPTPSGVAIPSPPSPARCACFPRRRPSKLMPALTTTAQDTWREHGQWRRRPGTQVLMLFLLLLTFVDLAHTQRTGRHYGAKGIAPREGAGGRTCQESLSPETGLYIHRLPPPPPVSEERVSRNSPNKQWPEEGGSILVLLTWCAYSSSTWLCASVPDRREPG